MLCGGCEGGGRVYLQGAVALKEKLSSRVLGSPGEGSKRSVFFLQQVSAQLHSTLQRQGGATVQPTVHHLLLNRCMRSMLARAPQPAGQRGHCYCCGRVAAAVWPRTVAAAALPWGVGFKGEYSSYTGTHTPLPHYCCAPWL